MIADGFRLHPGHDRRKRCRVRLLHRLQAAEVFEKTPGRTLAYAGDLQKFSGAVAHLAPLAMEGHCEAMGLIANELNQMQHRRMMIERDRIFSCP